MMTKSNNPTIRRAWNGQAQVETGDTHHLASRIEISVWTRWGIVQAGSNGKWIPEQQLAIDEDYRFSVGDYDVTVTRRDRKGRSDPKVINLNVERERRAREASSDANTTS